MIFVGGKLEATLALIYFDLAMREEEAIQRYVQRLKQTAKAIGRAAASARAIIPRRY